MIREQVSKWGKSISATVPGFAIIASNLGVPPGMSKIILGAVVEAGGLLILAVFHIQRIKFKRTNNIKVQSLTIRYFIFFLILLLIYLWIYDQQVIYNARYDESLFIPVKWNLELEEIFKKAGSVNNAINSYGPDAIKNAISNDPIDMSLTKTIFFLNYLLIFEMLTLAFAWSAVKSNKK